MVDATPWLALMLGVVVTVGWRFAGVVVSGRIDPEGAVFLWVQSVAYAMLAALVARMVVFPTGPLEETLLWHRVAAGALAVLVFHLTRRRLLVAVTAGIALFILVQFLDR